jgi:hypothetical protein
VIHLRNSGLGVTGILALLVCASLAGPRHAVGAESAGYRHSLFDGQSLAGWQVYHSEAGVENGCLKLVSGNGWLRAQQLYADFILELDWRSLQPSGYDSGIYIRAEMPTKPGQNWPSRYQINLKDGDEGNLKNLPGASSSGLANPGGQWNHFRITVVGKMVELEINGKRAWQATGLEPAEGFIGIQSEVPLGGQYEFKNIVVTELGFRSLYNGQDLSGWHVSSQTGHSKASGNTTGGRWVVEDGAITGTQDVPGNGGIVLTDEKFRDFEVALEMKNDFGPDSGLFLRSNDRGQAYQYMVDYHGAGNLAGVYGEGLSGKIHVRNFDFLDAPEKIKAHEAPTPLPISPEAWPAFWKHGQWNELRARVVANPPRVTTWINGVRFTEFEDTEKRHPDDGSIALQVHGGGDHTKEFVRYRNIRIKPLE